MTTAFRRYCLGTSLLALCIAGCDNREPVGTGPSAARVGGVKTPSGTTASPISSSSVLVTWADNSANEDGFRVERSATVAGPWEIAATTGAGATSIQDGGRASEQAVCYRVVALRRLNESFPSESDCTTPPAAPTGLTATRVDQQTVDLAWTDNSSAEDGYEVQRSTAESGPYNVVANLAAGAVSYHESGLSPGAYWYRVRAKRDGGFGDFSNLAFAPHPEAPPAPSGTNATPGGSNWVSITWVDNATNETGFRLQRSLDLGANWATVWTIYGQNVTATSDGGRASDVTVCYRVIAFNAQSDSPPSNVDCTAPPAAPSGLAATVVDYQTIDLAWTDNSGVEDGYQVLRASENTAWGPVADLPANSSSYRDVVTSDATYWYMIRAKKDGGYSNSSNFVRAVVARTPPTAPSGVDARPANSTIVVVGWGDNSTNEAGFRIERSTDAGASWGGAGTTDISITWFYDGARTSEQEVCYRVVAFNAAGDSPSSNVDCTTPPAAPDNLVATAVDGPAIVLTWTNHSAVADGYEVQRLFCYQDYYGWTICDYYTLVTLGPGTTSYTDTGLNFSESYSYRVFALKDGGSSDLSNEASATTNAPPE